MYNKLRVGEVAELVECARLEIAYTGNRIEGSNPSFSAKYKKPRRGIFYFMLFFYANCDTIIPNNRAK